MVFEIVGAILGIAILVMLVVALVKPERF
ncbi:potassium-transporting ATPase [Leucobacter sp. OLJS4]|nr:MULTISPECIES: potassium-transporting ATPase subunit F [unclassified Leucobacter]PII96792.1 potassium-transporting ATPase [Leucobacter sp. OLES1]PII84743.1 potassium-transporting ATPase [Leucobacter sp. OLCALW19]PII87836.1 potassium-transporting ATPase [Leucobacter sp. OLTLW20]PII92698.1 potassium-transporting ATPase [Leucobacter sp. OLAS13]PII98407.1 potassium-transporting ATPase [Leucobacter sp. OLDS2]